MPKMLNDIRRSCVESLIMNKPTKEQQKELKDFKLKIRVELSNFKDLHKVCKTTYFNSENCYTFKINKTAFKIHFDNKTTMKKLDKCIKAFTTTVW